MKEDWVGMARCMHGRDEKFTQNLNSENLNKGIKLEHKGEDRTILQ
jgi:hypothetical protein